jgi:hypothetical protein
MTDGTLPLAGLLTTAQQQHDTGPLPLSNTGEMTCHVPCCMYTRRSLCVACRSLERCASCTLPSYTTLRLCACISVRIDSELALAQRRRRRHGALGAFGAASLAELLPHPSEPRPCVCWAWHDTCACAQKRALCECGAVEETGACKKQKRSGRRGALFLSRPTKTVPCPHLLQ